MSDAFDDRLPEEFRSRDIYVDALQIAQKVDDELQRRVHGMLADYLAYAQEKAADALAEMAILHPDDARSARVFELQKTIAAYGHVIGWVRDVYDARDEANDYFEEEHRLTEESHDTEG